MTGEAADRQWKGLSLRRCLWSAVMAMIFIAAVLGAARLGIMLADRQGPSGHADQVREGVRRGIGPASALMIADDIDRLREYDFRSSGTAQAKVDGVGLFTTREQDVELEVLSGSDRRYLKVRVWGGEREGEVFWLLARQFSELPAAKRQ
jgi:hypothetical protein